MDTPTHTHMVSTPTHPCGLAIPMTNPMCEWLSLGDRHISKSSKYYFHTIYEPFMHYLVLFMTYLYYLSHLVKKSWIVMNSRSFYFSILFVDYSPLIDHIRKLMRNRSGISYHFHVCQVSPHMSFRYSSRSGKLIQDSIDSNDKVSWPQVNLIKYMPKL